MKRRGFLEAILAAGIAPAVGTAGIIMPPRHVIVPRPLSEMLVLWGDGLHNDTAAIHSLVSGKTVMFKGREYGPFIGGRIVLPSGTFSLAGHLRGH